MSLRYLDRLLVQPKSKDIDLARKEFILNILLLGCIFLAGIASVDVIINYFKLGSNFGGASPYAVVGFFLIFSSLLFASRLGYFQITAYVFITLLLIPNLVLSLKWGFMLPQALLMYSLIIVIAGILISSRAAFLSTFLIAVYLMVLSYLQSNDIILYDSSWLQGPFDFSDTIPAIVTLLVIATASWLFSREIEKALKRAWRSEAALKRQRDKLEITVERRTKQLKQAQVEKIEQLYRFAHFGRLPSCLFHDLATPLTVVSLNLKRLNKNRDIGTQELSEAKVALERAVSGTRKLEEFIVAARKQIQKQEELKMFNLSYEINQAIQILEHRAKVSHVSIIFNYPSIPKVFGNPLKFNQLMTNLISNSIDSYDKMRKKSRPVEIKLQKLNNHLKLAVQDWGSGISKENLPKVFNPLFTTKNLERGTGIGLSICKDIVEKDLKGNINAESKIGLGTTFTIEFPIRKSEHER